MGQPPTSQNPAQFSCSEGGGLFEGSDVSGEAFVETSHWVLTNLNARKWGIHQTRGPFSTKNKRPLGSKLREAKTPEENAAGGH